MKMGANLVLQPVVSSETDLEHHERVNIVENHRREHGANRRTVATDNTTNYL